MAALTPRLAGILVLGAAILAALFLLWQSIGTPDPLRREAVPVAVSDAALQWRAGQAQQYQVNINSSFMMTMSGGSTGQQMNLRMDGTLDFRTLSVDPAGANTGFSFDSLSLVIDGASDENVDRALETPFRVRFDRNGRPVAFEFPASLVQEHRDILENLVRMFQAVVASGSTWESEETNANGRYRATYTRASAKQISKTKGLFLPDIGNGVAPKVVSEEVILIDPDHDWITEMTLDERVIINDPASVPVRVENRAAIRLLSVGKPVPAQWAFSASPPEATLDPRASLPALTPEEAQRQLVLGVQAVEDAGETNVRTIDRLRDLLMADDQFPEMLLQIMRTEELSDRARADSYLAFELAGTPASQAALASVLFDSSWDPMDAMRAIVALGGVEKPTGDTLASLWDLARRDLSESSRRDLPGTAALAIGSLGNTMRESETPDYAALRDDLLASASGATEPSERAVFLYALGNTADPAPMLKNDLVSYLDDTSPQVRSAAATALGRLGTDQVEEELVTRVQQEPSAQARASMIEALESWDEPSPEAMQWARTTVQRETDELARYSMAVLLGNNMDDFPENRQVLETLLESEQSKRIRQKVANILY